MPNNLRMDVEQMNELALFAGAGIIKPFIRKTLWKPSDAVSAVINCRFLPSINALAPNRITRLARSANERWQKIGTLAIRKRQQPKCASGGIKMLMPLNNTAPTIGKSIIGKSLFVNTALSRNGLMSSYSDKKMPVFVANGNFNGATSKLRRMLITVTAQKQCVESFVIDVIQFLGFVKTMTSCYLLWRGI